MADVVIERSIWIGAPRERVWQAVTDPKQMEQWFLPVGFGMQLERDESGKLKVMLGPMAVEVAHFEAVEPPHRVTTRTLPDGVVATTYTLNEENSGTRVTVTMSGLDALEDGGAERVAPSGDSWEKALKNLKAFIDGAALPFPEGYIAGLFGYRRETAQKISVERSIWINAPRQRVWDAVTDPEQIAQWFSPGTTWRRTGLEVGARISVVDAETGADTHTQVIEAVEPPHLFVTRTLPEAPETPYVTRWALSEEKGGTRLNLIYSGYELLPLEMRGPSMEQNAFGFGMLLENLKALLEGAELPYPGGF